MNFNKSKLKALKNSKLRKEYDALEKEFSLIDQLITMRTKAGLTQEEVAKKLGTNKSNISRLEHGRSNPSWGTLNKYAAACGFTVRLDATEDDRTSAQGDSPKPTVNYGYKKLSDLIRASELLFAG